MKKIISYRLSYTPRGNGFVVFKVKLENNEINEFETAPLKPMELSALILVLSHKDCFYDEVQNKFLTNYDVEINPLSNTQPFA